MTSPAEIIISTSNATIQCRLRAMFEYAGGVGLKIPPSARDPGGTASRPRPATGGRYCILPYCSGPGRPKFKPMTSTPPDMASRTARSGTAPPGTVPSRDVTLVILAGAILLLGLLAVVFPWSGVPAGLAAMGLYLCAAGTAGVQIFRTYPHRSLGWCNVVTLLRLVLTAALVAPLVAHPSPQGWTIAAVGATALALDGADGWLSRREKLVSAFGARFDMEVDAALALALALLALVQDKCGVVCLGLGLARYAFVAAGLAWPWLAAPLPPSFRRKAVCVVQMSVLIALQAPPVTPPISDGLALLALAAVAWSFAADVIWLHRTARR